MKTTMLFGLFAAGICLLNAAFSPALQTDEFSAEKDVECCTIKKTFGDKGVFRCDNGKVSFKSDAPLEVISAKSPRLRGAIDTAKQTFAWSVDVRSFEGFNSPLQREHFNENYMESKHYPKASFTGKIIEDVDFSKNGTYSVRAKGLLNIHGVEQERIIKSQIEINGGKLRVHATFSVPLTDHNITIPKVVYQKIAEEITVTVGADMEER